MAGLVLGVSGHGCRRRMALDDAIGKARQERDVAEAVVRYERAD
ncbi:hypothetical protein ABZ178_31740 [Streptomyces massasporeus]|nr:hypothetical protein [Streptomyces massasporeus]